MDQRGPEAEAGKLRLAADTLPKTIADEITKARTLRSRVEDDPDNDLAAIRQFHEDDRAERLLTGKTRRQVLNIYERTNDKTDRTLVARIEQQGMGGVVLMDDPEHDAIYSDRLTKAIAARQDARVPKALFEALQRVEKVKKTAAFSFFVNRPLQAV